MQVGLGEDFHSSHDLQLLVVNHLHIVGRKEAVVPIRAEALPPPGVNLVNVRDDLAGVE